MAKTFVYLLLLAVTACTAQFERHIPQQKRDVRLPLAQQDDSIVPNAFIVELEGDEDVAQLKKRGLAEGYKPIAHAKFFSKMKSNKMKYRVSREFTSAPDIFHGAAVVLDGASENDLLSIAAVKNVWPVRKFQMAAPKTATRDHVKRATSPKTTDIYPPHAQIGVDKARAQGLTGKGVTIAIIDTGVDHSHPLLGGCVGKACKITKTWDFVGSNYQDTTFVPNAEVQDPDPICNIHGTHVAGIVAAKQSTNGFSGVATQANLALYRMLDCTYTSDTSILIAALLRAFADKADIINVSAGLTGGWTLDAASVIADRISAKGTLVVTSSGDNGYQGAFYPNSPASSRKAISVGSVEPSKWVVFRALVNTESTISYYGSHTFGPGTFSTYLTSSDSTTTFDACDPLSADVPDLTGKIAIVKRGGCSLDTKIYNVAANNARTLLTCGAVYNPSGAGPAWSDGIYDGYDSGNAGVVNADDSEILLQAITHNPETTITFPRVGMAAESNTYGGILSDYSSFGPTFDLYPVPKLLAPGSSILSLAPVSLGSYTVLTGTSMSAPFVAGSAALLVAKQKTCNRRSLSLVNAVSAALISSASPIRSGRSLVPVVQQGAGIVNVAAAYSSYGTTTSTFLLLNDTRHFAKSQKISLFNTNKKTTIYTVKHIPASSILTFNNSYPLDLPVYASRSAGVNFRSTRIKLKPGQKTTVVVNFQQPKGLTAGNFPVFSGYISVSSSNGKESGFRIPYLGMAARMYDMPILDRTSNLFGVNLPTLGDPSGALITQARKYSMNATDFPQLLWRATAGTAAVSVNVLRADNDAFVGSITQATSQPRNPNFSQSDGRFSPYNQYSFKGTLSNGTVLPDGSYILQIRALKITGNQEKTKDYDVWSSPQIDIVRN